MSARSVISRACHRVTNRAALRVLLFALVAVHTGAAQSRPHVVNRRARVKKKLAPIVTNEIRLVDDAGKTRLLFSTKSGLPVVQWLQEDGTPSLAASLDASGHGSVKLQNPSPGGPQASLEIDDKGAHVKFDRSSGASAYLFLNNAGGSGIVLIDERGKRRVSVLVQSDGSSTIERLDDQGKPLP
jgi:hypothetical protein